MNVRKISKPETPIEVKSGNTILKIYRGESIKGGTKYKTFTLCFYEGGQRIRRAFADLNEAKVEARRIAETLDSGEQEAGRLKLSDAQAWAIAKRELAPLDVPILEAVRMFVAAVKELPPDASLLEAARDYSKRHPANAPQKPLPEVVEEFLKAKEQDGASPVYLRTLRYHLAPLKERFKTPISNITSADLDKWLRGLRHTARTRNNALVSLTTLFRYARGQGYLAKNVPTEAEHVTRPKVKDGEIGIISPKQLQTILHAADTPERKIYFSLGAFTGIRATELSRLEWKDIDLKRRHVEIAADKAKTATRRLVPICDALYAWLLPYSNRTGKVFTSQRQAERLVQWAGKKIGGWPKNALRHSFVSYQVAKSQNVAETALLAGNSPEMIFSNYRELATKDDADQWFAIMPPEPGKIVPMPKPEVAA